MDKFKTPVFKNLSGELMLHSKKPKNISNLDK